MLILKSTFVFAIAVVFFVSSELLVAGGKYDANECSQLAKNVMEMNTIQLLDFELKEMMNAYKSGQPRVGIAMIEHGIRWLESLKRQNLEVIDEDVLTKDIAIFQVRLANLYRALGNEKRYDELINQAVSTYRSTGQEIDREDISGLVNKMDKSVEQGAGTETGNDRHLNYGTPSAPR